MGGSIWPFNSNDLHLRSLAAKKHCCLLNDEVGLYGGRLEKKRETDVSSHDNVHNLRRGTGGLFGLPINLHLSSLAADKHCSHWCL